MQNKLVKDLMVPIADYAVVPEDATIREALLALDRAQQFLAPGREHHRAVLVADKRGGIIGKLGYLAFLRGLEPKYNVVGDVEKLANVGVSVEIITMMMESYRFWQDDMSIICRRAKSIRVKDVMRPIEESIDENQPITEALHRIIMWQSLSILVKRGETVVGIVRLSDLFAEIADAVKSQRCEET